MYNKLPETVSTYNDIALVQCFYGTNTSRIRATTQALEFNFQMTSKPSTWVFVECQKRKSDCAFGWLRQHGVKHVFVPMKSENDGIMLKNSLWNIGADNCTEPRLCFIDSDVVMCNSDWVRKASEAFNQDGIDVLSLASYQYNQADELCKLKETVGYNWATKGKLGGGHAGFTFGITRHAFNQIGGFDSAIILADFNTYRKIIGDDKFKAFEKWVKPFKLEKGMEKGYNLGLSYADNIACHIWHGDDTRKYEDIVNLLVYSGITSIDDILDFNGILPSWKLDNSRASALRKTLLGYYKELSEVPTEDKKPEVSIIDRYVQEMQNLLGVPDEKHPLFVCTVVKDGFGLKLDDFIHFRDMVEDKFKFNTNAQPVVLFITDCKKFDFKGSELNVVPLKNYNPDDKFSQCLRKDLKFPKNAVIYYIPFDATDFNASIWVPNERIDNPDGSVLASK